MSLFMEIETDRKLPFDARKIAELVIETSLDYVKCPYETEVSLLLTTDEEIKEINRMQRQIDRATDVLSFPMADYETPGDFSHLIFWKISMTVFIRRPENCCLGIL